MIRSSKLYVRRFHVTSKLFLRKVDPKTSSIAEKHEFLKNNSDLSPNFQNSCLDYLGIESDENLINVIPQKYQFQQSGTTENKEKFYRTSFGIVRFDADNKLKYHGQHKNKIDFTFPHSSSEDVKVSNISEMPCENKVLQDLFFKDSQIESSSDVLINKSKEQSLTKKDDVEGNYIDEFYFGTSEKDNFNQNNTQSASEEINYFEQDYFGTRMHSTNTSLKQNNSEYANYKANIEPDRNENLVEKLNYVEKDPIKISTSLDNLRIEHNSVDFSNSTKVDSNVGDREQVDELNYLDKNYFGTLNNSKIHNTDYEKAINSALDTNKQNTFIKNNIISSVDELNFSDKNLNENFTSSKYQSSLCYDDLVDTSCFEKNNHINYKDTCEKNNKINQNKVSDSIFTGHSVNEIKELAQKQCYEANFEKLSSKQTQKSETYKNMESLANVSKKVHKETDNLFSAQNNLKISKFVSEAPDQNNEVSTAHDFVQKLREQQKIPSQIPRISEGKNISKEKFDSKGFRILKNQVQNLAYFTHDEILNILKQNIVYSDDDLLILNKPYSLVIHESKTTKEPCLSTFLDDLAKEMDKQSTNPKLFTVHRLDKETTGCLLLARNETMAMYLKALLAQRKIVKKYWIITSGVPDPPEGIIDIPISEGSINNRKRMVLHPKLPSDILYRNHSKVGKPAITTYKVISESGSAALVEVFPKTGIKHQIRVHFGFGLGCPVLGDHKYSHLDKLVPQKLPCDMLQKLHVRQSKVRHIPMHIHAKSIGIPEYFDKRDLFVNIPIPDYFKINLKRLKFKKKDMIH